MTRFRQMLEGICLAGMRTKFIHLPQPVMIYEQSLSKKKYYLE